eukprot:IDg180t1
MAVWYWAYIFSMSSTVVACVHCSVRAGRVSLAAFCASSWTNVHVLLFQ